MPASRSTKAESSATIPSSTGAAKRKASNLREPAFQLQRHERLLQHRTLPVFLRQTALTIAGGKDERHAAQGKRRGHRENVLALDMEIEDGAIEIARLGMGQCFLQGSSDPGHLDAQIGEGILD